MEENKMELIENVCENTNVEESAKRGNGTLKTVGLIGAGFLAYKVLKMGFKKIREHHARKKAEQNKPAENVAAAPVDDGDYDIEQPIDSAE